MARDSEVHAFMGHANPSLTELTSASGGTWATGDVCDPGAVAAFASAREIDLAMVSADGPLEAGVVDGLLERGIRTVGPTRAGAEIEWNKAFARELLVELAPEEAPRLRIARSAREVERAVDDFGDCPVVVKPEGLTGGKGVKVMGPHLQSHAEARAYARELLERGERSVLIEERILGAEFTIQAISDGRTVIFPPATYDYPYRYDGDEGPGTGGMGSLSLPEPTLPFMSLGQYERACEIIAAVIARLGSLGRRFSGVMNSGFFATAEGVKVIEFNARFGDPESMNILRLFEGSWTGVMERICAGGLSPEDVQLRPEASIVLYLVSPDYAVREGPPREFQLDRATIAQSGCEVFFASAVEVSDGHYRTVGTSRAVALAGSAATLEQARARVLDCAATVDGLEWRGDIGREGYMRGLSELVGGKMGS
jgi:phosphoribosylamine--glycine ligase